ncbi:MAG: hypothetical protein RLW62_21725, partial [Gammaproteobacteria bacterium]
GAAGMLWQACGGAAGPPPECHDEATRASLALAATARGVLARLQPLLGLRAVDTRSEINRVWRDFHTAGQHALFRRASPAVT